MSRVVSWNCKVGRSPDTVVNNLQALIRDLDPQVLLLQEAKGYVSAFRDAFGAGWQIFADGKDDPVMVREGIGVSKHGVRKYSTTWVGPQGGTQHGRAWTYVVIDSVEFLSLHRCWGSPKKNMDAYTDEYDLLVGAYGPSGRAFVVFGDTNTGFSDDYQGSMKRLAKATGGHLVGDQPPGIDYALVRGVQGSVSRKRKYGSDHEAALFVVR